MGLQLLIGQTSRVLQIFIASGGQLDTLGYFQNGMAPQVGHAIEFRLCAEDPNRDFVPDLRTIRRWTPASAILPSSQTSNIRFETCIETGSRTSIYFDSMIAKIIVWANTSSGHRQDGQYDVSYRL